MIDGDFSNIDQATIKSLRMMQKYALMHFASEEEYLGKINYPDIEEHIEKHRELSGKIKQYRDDISEGRLILNTELMRVLQGWLQDHILVEDMKYCQYASNK